MDFILFFIIRHIFTELNTAQQRRILLGKMQPELSGVKSVEGTAGLFLVTPVCALALW